MQHSTEGLKRSLLACIDKENNVTDLSECLRIISVLERAPITRKILEDTRLGKHINDIRRKTQNQELSKRLKNLVKKWRDMCQSEPMNGLPATGPGPGRGSNGRSSISPCLSAPSSIKSVGGCISPASLPSSCNTSPMRILSAPNTPSTVAYKSRTVSPCLSLAKGPLSSFHAKQRNVSPRIASPALSPPIGSIQSPKTVSSTKTDAPYTPSVDNVPRTNAANKRLRKDKEDSSELPPSKKSRQFLTNGFEDECSRDSVLSVISNDRISRASADEAVTENSKQETPLVRRSGRKRKRDEQNSNSSGVGVDPLRQKMAVIGANSSRVKTTSELLYDLAEKKGDLRLARRASRLEERVKDQTPFSPKNDSVSQNKKEHMEKFLKSTPGPPVGEDDDDDEITIIEVEDDSEPRTATATPIPQTPLIPQNPNSPLSNVDLLGISEKDTEEEILSRLPALDLNNILWDDTPPASTEIMSDSSDSDEEHPMNEVQKLLKKSDRVDSSRVQTLHSTNVDCQNGNFDMDGRFREWHELILQKGYQDTPLVVLPYVVTDF